MQNINDAVSKVLAGGDLGKGIPLAREVNGKILDLLYELFDLSPQAALEFCHKIVGQEVFTAALRRYIKHHNVKTAYYLALDRCLNTDGGFQ